VGNLLNALLPEKKQLILQHKNDVYIHGTYGDLVDLRQGVNGYKMVKDSRDINFLSAPPFELQWGLVRGRVSHLYYAV
jgi:hypothetical protein